MWITTCVVIHIVSWLHLWISPISLLTQERKGSNEILHLDRCRKTTSWAWCTYVSNRIVLLCKYFQVIQQNSSFIKPKWIVMTENRPQWEQWAWKVISILMNAKCALLEMVDFSQELRAALKHSVCLVSTRVHLGSAASDSFVPMCRFLDRTGYRWL